MTAITGGRAVVGGLVGREVAEGDVGRTAPLHLSRRGHPARVAPQEQLQHHRGVVGRGAVEALIGGVDGTEVEQFVDGFCDETGRVVLWQPVVDGGGQEELLGWVVGAERPCPPRCSTGSSLRAGVVGGEQLVGGPGRLMDKFSPTTRDFASTATTRTRWSRTTFGDSISSVTLARL